MKYNLFNINNYSINTESFGHMLHGDVKYEFEEEFAKYVGAKYACTASSASIIFYIAMKYFLNGVPEEKKNSHPIFIPSMIPAAIANIAHNLDYPTSWYDDVDWVGDSYVLYDTNPVMKCDGCPKKRAQTYPKIIDSAQKVEKNQFIKETDSPADVIVFSLYPTKPIGGMDGGIVVTNDENAAAYFKSVTNLGFEEPRHEYPNKENASEVMPESLKKSLDEKEREIYGSVDPTSEVMELKKRIAELEQKGKSEKANGQKRSWEQELVFPGWKANANSAQCYVALENLKKLDEKNERLKKVQEKYNNAFSLENNSFHLYRIDVKNRKEFIEKMNTEGLEIGIHYEPLHDKPFYEFSTPPNMHKTIKHGRTTVSIPFNETLEDKDVDEIISKINSTGLVIK